MKFNYLFLGVCITFFNQNEFVTGKPMIGKNVKRSRAKDFPYVVSLMQIQPGSAQSGGFHYCTGVLITRKDILTAAHCVENQLLSTVQLLIGSIDLRNGPVLYPFWWDTYDHYASKRNMTLDEHFNDIADIRTLASVPDHLIPVRLSKLSNSELCNAEVQVAGWGLNNEGIYPDIMEQATLQVIENRVCEQKVERAGGIRTPIGPRILCTFVSPYVLLQTGDSGGPLLFRNRLIGINSAFSPLSGEVFPDDKVNLHMSIDSYRNFIRFMKNLP